MGRLSARGSASSFLWDITTRKLLAEYPAPPPARGSKGFLLIALSPDLKAALIQDYHSKSANVGAVLLWTLGSGDQQVLAGDAELIGCGFSEDGKFLAIGEATPEVTIWEMPHARNIRRISGYRFALPSPDGKFLAAQSKEKSIRLIRIR